MVCRARPRSGAGVWGGTPLIRPASSEPGPRQRTLAAERPSARSTGVMEGFTDDLPPVVGRTRGTRPCRAEGDRAAMCLTPRGTRS